MAISPNRATRPFRRRRIVVDRAFQWSICVHGVALGVLVLVSMSIGIFVPLLGRLGDRAPNTPTDVDSAVVMLYMHENFWFVAFGCLLLVTAGALRLSHRIAGPMVRFKRNLRFVALGKLPPPLRTRRNDYLKAEVTCLNDAVQGVRMRVEAIRAAAAEVRREVHVLADATGGAGGTCAELLTAHQDLERSLAAFTETGEIDLPGVLEADALDVASAPASRSV